ncbi:MAG: sulfur carrier protein ThiS [Deltaproteobacteria bacterium]|nr:sulfur carrier protein ThiS [Deltaproteobacteria bacterium]
MRLTVNGEPHEVPPGLTIIGLLGHLEIKAPRVAVEVNRVLVPRTKHAEHLLAEGDQVEIVTFVGGG